MKAMKLKSCFLLIGLLLVCNVYAQELCRADFLPKASAAFDLLTQKYSEERIVKEIRAKNGQFQNKSEGFNKLMKKYTSEVSPDRKGIITSGLKAVSRNKQSGLKPIDLLATILEGMLMCGKATYKNLIDSRPLFRIFFGEIFSKALDYNVAQ